MLLRIDSSAPSSNESVQIGASLVADDGTTAVSDTFVFENGVSEVAIVVELENRLQHKLGRLQAQAATLASFPAAREIGLKTPDEARTFLGLDPS